MNALRLIAISILFLYASLCALIGIVSSSFPLWDFSHYISPLIQNWWYIVGPLAALIGIGTLFRLRFAAIGLSALYVLAAANDQLNLIVGDLSLLPGVNRSSPTNVAIIAS